MDRDARRPRLPRRARGAAARLLRAPDAAVPRRAPLRARRARAVAQARGPHAHGVAQAQQRPRAGAARAADGQGPRDRRDGGGPARRRQRDGRGAPRSRVRRLHGQRGHAAPGAQRRAHAPAGCDGRARRGREQDAEGGDVGGDPRLGHERRVHPLHHRLGRRAGAVPGARARPAARHRRRGARGAPRAHGAAAGPGHRLRRGRLERDGDVRRVRRRSGRPAHRRRGRRRGHRDGTPRRAAHRGRPGGRAARGALRASCRTRTVRSPRRTRSRRASTTPAPVPSTRGCATRAARPTSR